MTLPVPLPTLPIIPSDDIRRQVFAHATSLTFSGNAIDPPQSNERLEFLGDSYLNFCVSNIIFREFPTLSPGELTALKAGLVSNANLNIWSRAYGLNNHLVMGYSMAHLQIPEKAEKLIADVFEAYVGGVIVSNPQGREQVEEWLEKLLGPTIDEQRLILDGTAKVDKMAVSRLYQEATAKKKNHKVDFKFVETETVASEERWECTCLWNGQEKGRAKGRNRQEAKHRVASIVLEVLKQEQDKQQQCQEQQ
jgi:dsRNA-specific ribonuclease